MTEKSKKTKKTKGRVTLPSQQNFYEETIELMERWGADAIRDSDGTKLDDELKQLGAKVYTTYFIGRNHNEFIEKHREEITQAYLMSARITAPGDILEIPFMEEYFAEQIQPDYIHDPKEWWEVINRTTGEVVDVNDWVVDEERDVVTLTKATPWHEYTVSFLAYMIWDPTQMYNHITNDWGDVPHDIPFDVRGPNSNQYMQDYLKQWLKDNPDTDVVRFTTFFYHFTLIFNNVGKQKLVDWFGYGTSMSVAAIEAFEKERGYRLRPEHFIDEGYYNSSFRIPSQEYLDYIDFTQQYVNKEVKKFVDIVHESGKEAMMFLGDDWIGTEPYGEYFKQSGIDGVVGSAGDGLTLRLISEIPHVKFTEGRFLPYFFPDTFYEGNDPVPEAVDNWLSARRAMMRKPVDRIGYGGYPSLAYNFPTFIDYIEKVTDEFRLLYDNIANTKPHTKLKVGVINAWGKIRSWQTHIVAHAIHYKQIYSYQGVLEALSGMDVDVEFISFDDVINNGVPESMDVIINAGDAGTSFSGGDYWKNPELISKIREWVANGGGFIGVGEPSAVHFQGKYFQLADILGVDKELGFSLSSDKYFTTETEEHFIKDDIDTMVFGESMNNIYSINKETEILEFSNDEIHLSSNDYGKGRGIYIAGLPYSYENTRLLKRALFYAAHKEEDFFKWESSNLHCEVHVYPDVRKYAILNNLPNVQETTIFDGEGNSVDMTLEPGEIKWEEF